MKIAIIGAGSTYTPELIEGIILRSDRFPVTEMALMDIDTRKLSIVGGLTRRMVNHSQLPCTVSLTEDPDRALEGAAFVFVQIRVGCLAARVLDEKIPRKYRLLGQETTGIGGFLKALRTIPVLLDISGRMETLCPDAFMINFSNPSGINAQAILTHTKTRMMGLCNGPIGMMSGPQKALGLPVDEAELDYVGMNHLSFVTSVRHGGRDYLKEAVNGDEALLDKLNGQQGFEKEIIRLAQAIPVSYVNYYYRPRKTLYKDLAADTTRGEDCIKIEGELLTLFSDEALHDKPEQLSKRGGAMYSEAAVSLAESIWRDTGDVHVINTLNRGAIPFMEYDDVVETRARVGKNGAEALPAAELGSPMVRQLMRAVKTYERYTVMAALSGSRDDAIRALMCNPLIQDLDTSKACFDELLSAHKEYLPAFFKTKG